MNLSTQKIFVQELFFLILTLLVSCSKNPPKIMEGDKSLISIRNDHFRSGISNVFKVIAQQEHPITINQVRAFQVNKSGEIPIKIEQIGDSFLINFDTIGLVAIHVDLGDTIEVKRRYVRSLEAVGYLGNYRANSKGNMGVGEFKAQRGIIAEIECCQIDARCKILRYEVMRINKEEGLERLINKGAKFETSTKQLINKATIGDFYIFRDMKYRCPGPNFRKRLDDMIFEIK